ncbi:hypothetical protein Y694_02802 [Methylibium sp. T29-B]|uniref:hypothetical protein n=1 Tax=Methylibium sp. T29-B TaxID=1437443 RepID=UPI0003F467DC|nr:hypothetical protein [Methylibium sp. T29-B]EWS59382.1 hypothetical protein Y694_02802 [Methylibium sp. T29-B]
MRIVFGALGLLVALAIVGSLVKRQLQAVGAPVRPEAASAAGVALPAGTGTPLSSRSSCSAASPTT